jgi:hypothetical protein
VQLSLFVCNQLLRRGGTTVLQPNFRGFAAAELCWRAPLHAGKHSFVRLSGLAPTLAGLAQQTLAWRCAEQSLEVLQHLPPAYLTTTDLQLPLKAVRHEVDSGNEAMLA